MKKIRNWMPFVAFSAVAAIVTALCYILGDGSLADLLVGDGLIGIAMAVPGSANLEGTSSAVNGQDGVGKHLTGKALFTTDTRNLSPDLIENPIDRDIVKMYQQALPIDQLLRFTKGKQTQGMVYKYYSVDTRPILGKVVSNTASGANTLPKSTNAGKAFDLYVEDVYIFNVGDTIRVSKVLGFDKDNNRTNGVYLMLYVTGRDATKLTVQALNGPTTSYNSTDITLAANTVLYRVATAAHEGDVQIAAYSALPTWSQGNMQIFKSQTMETRIHMDSQKEIDWTKTDQDEYMLFDFRRQLEAAFIFGVKSDITDLSANRQVMTCSGAIEQILANGSDNVITFDEDGLTDDVFVDWCKQIFIGNNGSHERAVFVGSELLAYITKLPYVQKQIGADASVIEYGYTWNKIVSPFGVLKFYMHPLFDEFGFSNCALVLDTQYVEKRIFRSLEQNALELEKAGVFDGRANVLTEISSIVLKYPKCHKLIVPETFNTAGTFGEDVTLAYTSSTASDDDASDGG